MFGMGFGELLVVLVIVLVVFGPGRLPEMMGHLGKGLRAFRKGLHEPPEVEKAPETPGSVPQYADHATPVCPTRGCRASTPRSA